MAKLIYSMLTSLDGYTEDAHGKFGWGAPEDEAVHSYVNELASSVDLAPTVLRAAGAKPTGDMTGVDLLNAQARAGRAAVFGEVFEHNAIDIHKPAANLQHRWVVEGNWKLILPHEPNVKGGKPELYDLSKDPHETANLAAMHPDRVTDLTKKLDAWWKPEKN